MNGLIFTTFQDAYTGKAQSTRLMVSMSTLPDGVEYTNLQRTTWKLLAKKYQTSWDIYMVIDNRRFVHVDGFRPSLAFQWSLLGG